MRTIGDLEIGEWGCVPWCVIAELSDNNYRINTRAAVYEVKTGYSSVRVIRLEDGYHAYLYKEEIAGINDMSRKLLNIKRDFPEKVYLHQHLYL